MSKYRAAYWLGVRQGLTWPVSFPMMWLLYGLGMFGYWVIEGGRRDDDSPYRWYHHAAYRLYQWGTIKSVFWNDMGGFDLWRKP